MSSRTPADLAGTATATGSQRYTLPAAGGAIWLGLGPAALTGLAVTLLLCVGLMLTGTPLWPVLLLAATGAVVTAWPVAGRTLLQWLPSVTTQLSRRLRGADRWHRPLPEPTDTRQATRSQPLLRTPTARTVRLVSRADEIGLLHDRRHGIVTVALATSPTGRFGLLDPDSQDSELHRWGSSLAGLLSLPQLRHLQWIVHSRPDTTPPSTPGGSDQLAQDHALLVAAARAQARSHQQLLTLTLAVQSARRVLGDTGQAEAVRQLAHGAAREASAALLAADLLSYPLTTTELPRLLRQLTDPTLPQHAADELHLLEPAAALSAREHWTHSRTDDTVHRSYAITGWPRTAQPADWLAALLHHPLVDGTARTLSVQARPVAPQHAARRARVSSAKARLDTADRQRLGFTPAASSALDELDAEHIEAELLAGYRMAELTSLITLHAPDAALLDEAARSLRTAAVSYRLDLRPLHGQHQHALAVSLPLGLSAGGRR